ncbi:MAG: glycosyltransferase family 4 protein [Nitrososphaerales archaeon]
MHNTIAPYRHPLFEELSKTVDLLVYQCSVKEATRKWDLWPRNYNYRFKVLPRIPVKTSVGDSNLNPTIMKEIVKNRPHVVIISGYTDPTTWLAFVTCKILKIPIIYWTEGIREPRSIMGILSRPIRRLFTTKSNAVIVPGRLSKEYIIRLGATKEKIFIAPNTIDNKLFVETAKKYSEFKNQLKTSIGFNNKIVIFSVGQLIERKGFRYLLEAYSWVEKEHNNVALLICGSGPIKNSLIELADRLKIQNLKIIESGMSLEKLIKLYSIADIFVLPTLEDVWGFVINEAIACGLPVISTSASQAAIEMIDNGKNGYIVKERDSRQLYNALKKLIVAPDMRILMGFKSRETVVNDFDVSKTVSGFMSAIEYCLKGKRKQNVKS